MKLWRITYLPASERPRVIECVFQGTKEDLDKYLQENHSCSCSDCDGKDWWESVMSAEYLVEIIEEDEYGH